MGSGLHRLDIDPGNLDPDGICENQTTAGAADLVLNGALCDLGTALQFDISDAYSAGIGGVLLAFDSAGDISGVIFTITGKDQDGVAITETVTNVTTTAVLTTKYYSQVTNIAADSQVTSNVFVGTVTGELATKSIPINRFSQSAAAVAVSGLTGTCQFDIAQTFDDFRDGTTDMAWFNVLSNQSADVAGTAALGATGVRLVFDSYSNGAELQFHVSFNPFL